MMSTMQVSKVSTTVTTVDRQTAYHPVKTYENTSSTFTLQPAFSQFQKREAIVVGSMFKAEIEMENVLSRLQNGASVTDDAELLELAQQALAYESEHLSVNNEAWAHDLAQESNRFND